MSTSSPSSSSFFDTLFYCEEQQPADHHPWQWHHQQYYDHDFLWEDEELVSLFTKQQQTLSFLRTDPSLLIARKQAVDWILKVKSHFGFSHLTAILSMNYLDRFLSSLHFQKDKPWMIQLLAVTCLSLAAKTEQTQVPSLLDLQVEETQYMFEAKTIQKMELLVMSTLKWKMNPVTPISFLDHIVRRLGLMSHHHHHLHWDCFFKKCEDIILSLVSDSRFVGYEPSVMATATMLHVIEEVDLFNSVDYQNQLLDVLKTTKDLVSQYPIRVQSTCSTVTQNQPCRTVSISITVEVRRRWRCGRDRCWFLRKVGWDEGGRRYGNGCAR
ncbi:Cyclin, C-terminal domain-containing protein [Cynara cardunculus var. scolymus]|uniref:Cyclin, C-terminal domain-containing protein n=1 Tax=Cynara cardunculus var. scolymus TaxID=59895 RepID=A0A103XMB4_CYNCS|nr:Cyclin, C-terminal domain-containing protein [Cynara cardunculus var. scolymus]